MRNENYYTPEEEAMAFKAKSEAVVSIAKTLRSPDWEQRRYEIAKDILPHTILLEYHGKGLERGVKDAVMIADTLIKELRKESKE